MTTDKKKHPPPFSLRLTREERLELEKQSVGVPLGAYVRERLFGPKALPRRTRGKFPVQDQKALARLLALLGQSNLSKNLADLAHASRSGSLTASPETQKALQSASHELSAMKRMLMIALGLQER